MAQELWRELVWASARPESRARADGFGFDNQAEFEEAMQNDVERVRQAFEACLTTVEAQFLEDYRRLNPAGAYSLNQNPDWGATMSNWSKLHTLIRNCGILWCCPKLEFAAEGHARHAVCSLACIVSGDSLLVAVAKVGSSWPMALGQGSPYVSRLPSRCIYVFWSGRMQLC